MPLRPAEGASDKLIPVFKEPKKLLVPYARGLTVVDEPRHYVLTGLATPMSQGKEVWFGGAVIAKRYVSFHLMLCTPSRTCSSAHPRSSGNACRVKAALTSLRLNRSFSPNSKFL